ncbi:hypothetical protein DFQ28_001902 [Apophysomyces sp. BC1034]|nr:hypothetical protein DFQ30_003047 [Apophysomyces sp. BC1015]KAG0177549.1 hypothetical protein DFQ29_004707 [Apophysomyces sp. BC1021]KAG0190570.1 hypothetical protein DFQ28_001902 [Apophysomyces sp. BC1034]
MPVLNWGIIGTGNIAKTFAIGLQVATKGRLVAVSSRSAHTAVEFGKSFNVTAEKCYDSYDNLLNDPDVDIVYIATPHPNHCEIAVAAAKARKHMLLEKPMAMNEAEATRIFEAVRTNDVFFMEAYMYRCHPQTIKTAQLVREGAIGQVKLIRANFSFDGRPLGPTSRLWRNELGGGAILDIGGYPMSFSRLIAGVANQQDFANPVHVKAVGHIQPDTQIDEWAVASLAFDNAISAQLFTGIFADSDSSVEVIGSKGSIKVRNLWRPDLTVLGPGLIELNEHGKETEIIPVLLGETNLYAIEADAVADAVLQGQKECKFMTWNDSLGQIRAMDQWRKEIGLVYPTD